MADPDQVADGFNWAAAEQEVGDIAAPMFLAEDGAAAEPDESAWEVESAGITLADVGGMGAVKDRLEAAFLAPMRNPELRQLYGKSLRGGLLLYGPPGCGKTFIARAVAGELGARFVSVGLADILDMYIGNSERNLAELFGLVRREAPCVLFLDEIDALGQKRSATRNSAMRGAVVQLLTELDGVAGAERGRLRARGHQPAVGRRPGAAPARPAGPDAARAAAGRRGPRGDLPLPPAAPPGRGHRPAPSGQGDGRLLRRRHRARLRDGVGAGADRQLAQRDVRMIGMRDLESALREVRPSIGGWLETARNVVLFADEDGTYAELRDYLKKAKRL